MAQRSGPLKAVTPEEIQSLKCLSLSLEDLQSYLRIAAMRINFRLLAGAAVPPEVEMEAVEYVLSVLDAPVQQKIVQ